MEKLRAAGLFGGALVQLSGSLATRYNACLALLGVPPTQLKSFAIDGMGWSPEIAAEKKDNYYLNTGAANVNAIVISPEQKDKPLYMPWHSFDRDVMQAVFEAYPLEIKDITRDAALVLNLDQHIPTFFEPFDLLRYAKIKVTFTLLENLDEKQMEQEAFINLFKRNNNFIDREVHMQLLNSAKKYGDLRGRKLSLEALTFQVGSFYTKAFRGVFVLKDAMKEILIFEDEQIFKNAIKDTVHDVLLFHSSHDELIQTLVSHLVLEEDFKSAIKTPRYERIRKHIFAEYSTNTEHPIQEVLESHFLFTRYLNELPVEVQKKISGATWYYQKSIIDKSLKISDFIKEDDIKLLYEPHSSLGREQQELIWKLLVKMMPKDPVHLYWYDKAMFYKLYADWNPSYKDWVIQEILKNNKRNAL